MSNDFEDLLSKLKDGRLSHNLIQMAYRAWVRENPKIPDEIKNILCGKEGGGLLGAEFNIISQTIGNMELVYRRGYSAGYEDGLKRKHPTMNKKEGS